MALSFVQPLEDDEHFYRNAQGDEVVYVSDGEGVLESPLGSLPFGRGDYLVMQRGIVHRYRFTGRPARLLVIESAGFVRTPQPVPERVRTADGERPVQRARHPEAGATCRRSTRRASSRSS